MLNVTNINDNCTQTNQFHNTHVHNTHTYMTM